MKEALVSICSSLNRHEVDYLVIWALLHTILPFA